VQLNHEQRHWKINDNNWVDAKSKYLMVDVLGTIVTILAQQWLKLIKIV